ncbi:hypothetical protein N9Y42_11155 [Mariniblastus sp.]|nr:hypothetical protein [Mariniblastus sp.]
MPDRIAINISAANTKAVEINEVLDYFESHHADCKTYRKVVPPGVVLNDAFQFMAVLGAVGSVASIASLIWDAYEKFVAPTKDDDDDNAGFMISIAPMFHRDPMMFWVGGKYKSRDEFMREFERISKRLDDEQLRYNDEVDKLMENSDSWIPRSSEHDAG